MRLLSAILAACSFAYLARGGIADLETTRFQYDAGITAVHSARLEAERALSNQYTNTLHSLRVRAQNAGDLDTVKQLIAEKARFDAERRAPVAQPALPELRNLALALGRRLREIEVKEATDTIRQAQQYEATLSALQTALTRQGKIDEASAVQNERKALAASETYLQAKATIAEAPSPAKPRALSPPALSIAELLTSPDYEWTKPENLGPNVNSATNEVHVTLSEDELTLVTYSDRPKKGLWEHRRQIVTDPFGDGMALVAPSGALWVGAPSLSGDGLRLVFNSTAGPHHKGKADIYEAGRLDRNSPWSNPENAGYEINSSDDDLTPSLSPDGMTLFFSSIGRGGPGGGDLWRSRRKSFDKSWESPKSLGNGVNTSGNEYSPKPCSDNRTILFARENPVGNFRLFMATPDASGELSARPLDLPVTGNMQSPQLSRDGSTLYFTSDCPGGFGGYDVWKTRRVPRSK